MAKMSIQKGVTAAGVSVMAMLGGAYANERYAITSDIVRLRQAQAWFKRNDHFMATIDPEQVTSYYLLKNAALENEMLWFEGRTWTYAQALIEIDRLSTVFHHNSIGPNDVVAVFMSNSPEMVFLMYALSRLGAVPALVNTALRAETLAHCMNVASAKAVVCTPDLLQHIMDLPSTSKDKLGLRLSVNLSSFPPLHVSPDVQNLDQVIQIRYEDLAAVSQIEPESPARRGLFQNAFLMYTSGTSGKPKAVAMKNVSLAQMSLGDQQDHDYPKTYFPLRIFSCLPLFHATAFMLGMIGSMGSSSTLCLVRRFSATKLSQQLTESQATRMLYVGELCRYLLKAPPSKYDKAHKCIVAAGNGLKADVWNKFRERFNIREIREFYRSTEGIAAFTARSLSARDAGYVGRTGPIYRHFDTTTYIVKYDFQKEAPWRDPQTGLCAITADNEPGEAIGRVLTMETYREYLNNPAANDAKLIRDVFTKGDLFQRTGDLLIRDKSQRIKFADRSGDTYRWRGENVSAGEVREHISRIANVHDVSVYGVTLPAYDGQMGAAGVTLDETSFEARERFVKDLFRNMRAKGLTTYQIPRLLRLTRQIDTTATFKHVQNSLKSRSWDPAVSSTSSSLSTPAGSGSGSGSSLDDSSPIETDLLYWLDGEMYKPLDSRAWKMINDGKARL